MYERKVIIAVLFSAFVLCQADDDDCLRTCYAGSDGDRRFVCDEDDTIYLNKCHFYCADADGGPKDCPVNKETCFKQADLREQSPGGGGYPRCTPAGVRYPTWERAFCDLVPNANLNDQSRRMQETFDRLTVPCSDLRSVENWSPSVSEGNAARPAICLISMAAFLCFMLQQV